MTDSSPTPRFQPLTGVYEPSAVQQLQDGRFLVLEDEKAHPFSLVRIEPDGRVTCAPLDLASARAGETFGKLNDLEGIALDAGGYLHAITSHSRASDGEEKRSRDKWVRFRIEGERVLDPRRVTTLKPALLAAQPALAAAAAITDVKRDGGLNIEALEFSLDQRQLLIGFRGPLLDGRAIIARIENPREVFETAAPPRIGAALTTLDLGGDGIRGLSRLPELGGYLLIAGPVGRGASPFRLWFWNGDPAGHARRVTVPGLEGFERAEGVCPAVIEGTRRLLIVSDDGDRKAGRCAGYLLLDPARLVLE